MRPTTSADFLQLGTPAEGAGTAAVGKDGVPVPGPSTWNALGRALERRMNRGNDDCGGYRAQRVGVGYPGLPPFVVEDPPRLDVSTGGS